MKYENLNKEELLEKINQFEIELKSYVRGVDERYKVFFERNLAGIYRTKMDGEVLDCNDAMAQILGYKNRDELVGQNAKVLYYDLDDRDQHLEMLKDKKFIKNRKLALRRKDGSKIWVSISTTAVVNANNKTEYLEGTMIDITELIATQDKLILSEENYKTMLDESPYGIIIHQKGRVKYFNNRANELLDNMLEKIEDLAPLFPKKLINPRKKGKQGIDHLNRVEINCDGRPIFLDVYVKNVVYENKEATELSFVDIQDRIELEEEKIKTSVFKSLNDSLKKEIKEKEKVEKELMSSLDTNTKQSAKLEAIFENSSHVMWTMDKEYHLTSFNANLSALFYKVYGRKPQIDEKPFEYDVMTEKERKQWKEAHDKVFKGEVINFITENKDPKGRKIYMNVFMNPIYDEKKKAVEASGIGHDITDKVIAEAKLTESLKEKEVLIKEIHHRVKNNLQVISSIFNLQSAFTEETGIKEVLRESQNRIKSMAYIHESLYKSSELGQIDFEQYVKELSKNLIHSYAYKDNQISLLTETENVLLELDIAIPCGLIVNEIVSNSLKHAFVERKNGIIAVFLKNSNNKVKLRLTDDGVGMDEKIFDGETNSLGVQLIQTLAEQIKGEVSVDGSNGTTIEITFPLN